jgi:DNA-binding NarL/FixJ family response regulator
MKAEKPKSTVVEKSNRIRVLVVDDHPLTRVGIAHVIGMEPDFECCGEASSAAQALDQIKSLCPHVVLCDISIPGDGIELVKDIKIRYPKLPVIVITMHEERIYAERSFKAGAMGYLLKSEVSTGVVGAIRKVLNGSVYMTEQIASDMLKIFAGNADPGQIQAISLLSDRELQVFRLIGIGRKITEIAKELSLSVKTVNVHRAHIMEKMKIEDAHNLTFRAFHWVNQSSKETAAK